MDAVREEQEYNTVRDEQSQVKPNWAGCIFDLVMIFFFESFLGGVKIEIINISGQQKHFRTLEEGS